MSLTPSLRTYLLAGLCVALATAGCSDSAFDSSFVYSTSTTSLMREAQDGTKELPGVKKLLDDRFGDPQNLKAWLKLPVDFGGSTATVVEFATANGVLSRSLAPSGPSNAPDSESSAPMGVGTRIRLAVEEGQAFPETVTTIQFVNGTGAGQSAQVSAWDSATGEATLTSAPGHVPATGDTVAINGGSHLRSGRTLYMRHCSHCHGTSGDGNGPTAQYLNPMPRDYRHGIFKFTSTNDMSKASRKDLTSILKYGIPGTYMPSFLLMKDEEVYAIIEYVRFLSMRGEYERKLDSELAGDFSQKVVDGRIKAKESRIDIAKEVTEFLAVDLKEAASTLGDDLAEQWTGADSEDALILPSIARIPDSPESRRRGRELFLSKALNCADCHGVDGAGNGPQTIAFEKNPLTGELYNEPGLHDVWDNENQPRNLHYGIYRGGRRPIDLFCRIHAGIKGSRMPSFKNTPHEDIWNVVNYVLSIPFETEPGATGVPSPAAAPAAVTAPQEN